MNIKELLNAAIRFINLNYLILLLFISVIYVAIFIIMIAKFKKLCFFEFGLFIISLLIIGIHFASDAIGYSIYWETRSDLTLIFFATVIYALSMLLSFISFIIRLAKKPKEKPIKKEVVKNKEIEAKPEEVKIDNNSYDNSFINYLARIDDAIGLYDDKNNCYHLTKKMESLLSLDSDIINVNNFKNLILDEDLELYDKMLSQKDGNKKYVFRLNTNGGIIEIEENREVSNGRIISSFKQIKKEIEKIIISDSKQLELDITNLVLEGNEFGLIFVLINNNQTLIRNLGKINAFRVISDYFKMISKDLFAFNCKIYEIGSREYCILTKNIDLYYDNLKMVKNHNSNLIEGKISFKEEDYFVTNVLGFVNSSEVMEKNSLEYLEAGRLILSLALNKGIDYMEYKISKLNDDSSEFEKLKVDLSNKFLDDL